MDRYSKIVLTVIAICLVWIGARDLPFIPDAMAASGVLEVKVVEMDLSRYRPIPVAVKGEITCK